MADRRFVAMAAVAVLGLVAGCSGIPKHGRVVRLGQVQPEGEDPRDERVPPVRRVPAGPRDGASPTAIVLGFVDAQASFDGDHAVARSFLGPETRWDDGGDVVVYDGREVGEPAIAGSRAEVVVRVRRTGTVAAGAGEYRPAVPTRLSLRFVLRRVNGEWRIADAPAGVIVGETSVSRAFRRTTLYFPDVTRERLVPQPLFLPAAVETPYVTVVLRALLAGPPSWLAPAVRTAIPPGTQVIGTPSVDDGVVTVDLSREAGRASTETLPLLVAQLVWTLTEPELGLTGVRLLVEGDPLVPPGGRSRAQGRSDWAGYTPEPAAGEQRALLARGDGVHALGPEGAVPVRSGPPGLIAFSVSRSGLQLAAVAGAPGGRARLLVGQLGEERLRDVGLRAARLTEPAWEPAGDVVWTIAQDDGAPRVLAVPVDGARPTTVRAPGLTQPVTAFQLAPDGVRAVLVLGAGAERTLWQAQVQPQPDGTQALAGLRQLSQVVGDVSAVTWASATRLVVVGRVGGRAGLYQLGYDGYGLERVATDGLPGLPSRIAGARSASGPGLLAEVGGRVWRRERAGWLPLVAGYDPTYAG